LTTDPAGAGSIAQEHLSRKLIAIRDPPKEATLRCSFAASDIDQFTKRKCCVDAHYEDNGLWKYVGAFLLPIPLLVAVIKVANACGGSIRHGVIIGIIVLITELPAQVLIMTGRLSRTHKITSSVFLWTIWTVFMVIISVVAYAAIYDLPL